MRLGRRWGSGKYLNFGFKRCGKYLQGLNWGSSTVRVGFGKILQGGWIVGVRRKVGVIVVIWGGTGLEQGGLGLFLIFNMYWVQGYRDELGIALVFMGFQFYKKDGFRKNYFFVLLYGDRLAQRGVRVEVLQRRSFFRWVLRVGKCCLV